MAPCSASCKDLREMLEGGSRGMGWNDKRLRDPLQARVLEELSAMDIAPDVAHGALAARAPRRTGLKNHRTFRWRCWSSTCRWSTSQRLNSGGITAVVGPTGAGKTTTIAKLAARWCMQHGSQDLALVSTDGYRIGAREQLMTYARILGAPMHARTAARNWRGCWSGSIQEMMLIDTAGMGPRDVRLSEQLSALQLGRRRRARASGAAGAGRSPCAGRNRQAFARVAPAACILTKVDEAASLGAVISTTLRHKLKIAYLCDGQRVPEDLHAAHSAEYG
jgi:flagellar biosynthesis protein FlhF